jgi:hypothetical protein
MVCRKLKGELIDAERNSDREKKKEKKTNIALNRIAIPLPRFNDKQSPAMVQITPNIRERVDNIIQYSNTEKKSEKSSITVLYIYSACIEYIIT